MPLRFAPAISSMSLGRAWNHALESKLSACSQHGFRGIELFHEDLEYVARCLPISYPASPAGTSFTGSSDWDEAQLAAAAYIRQLCNENGLDILCLQPFMHYDGLTSDKEHAARIQKMHLWFKLAKILNTDLIQIPSNFLPSSQCTSDRRKIVADLVEVADLGLKQTPVIRFAYEALCWGTNVDLWDEAWDIVQKVNRPNFGTCLDTFNLAGRVWADPSVPSGKTENADADLAVSLNKLKNIDISKVFYVEVVDAERLQRPLVPGHEWWVEGQKARMSWSRNARLFPFEKPGYLPVLEILKTICNAGFQGWISFELFSRTMNAAHDRVPEEHAQRGEISWKRLVRYMGWDAEEMYSDYADAAELHGARLRPVRSRDEWDHSTTFARL